MDTFGCHLINENAFRPIVVPESKKYVDGAQVVLDDQNSRTNPQDWYLNHVTGPWFQIQNSITLKVMEVAEGATGDQEPVVVRTRRYNPPHNNQLWKLIFVKSAE